jgi:hypothetical protein
MIFHVMFEPGFGPYPHVILVGIRQFSILIVLLMDDGLKLFGLFQEYGGEVLEFASAHLDTQVAVMDMDVLFHVEEKIAVTRFSQNVATIKCLFDDAHSA